MVCRLRRRSSFLVTALTLVGTIWSCQSAEHAKSSSTVSDKASVETARPSSQTDESSAMNNEGQNVPRKLIVYYLHGTYRCHSCNKIERLTREAVEQGFANQIDKGRVEIKSLNVEEDENKHFVQDYKLYTKSVILSDLKDNRETRWKNLERVWTLLANDAKFMEYIQNEVNAYLEG